jgi:hypothetical protein
MRPCVVCGGVTVDAQGHCTACRAFRGPPGSAQLASGDQRGHLAPISPPPVRVRAFVLPIVALLVALIAVFVAIVIVVAAHHAQFSGSFVDPTTPAPSESSVADVDGCLVGRWRVTSQREDVAVPNVGRVAFTGSGAQTELRPDGTGRTDFGDGTLFKGTLNGRTIRLEVRGELTFRFTARDGTISVRNTTSRASAQIFVDGLPYGGSEAFEVTEDPASYECLGNIMIERTGVSETRFTRLG